MAISKTLALACAAVLAQYPEADHVHACADGNVFLPHVVNLAENHCRMAKLSEPVKVTREDVAELIAAEVKRVKGAKVTKAKPVEDVVPANAAETHGEEASTDGEEEGDGEEAEEEGAEDVQDNETPAVDAPAPKAKSAPKKKASKRK